MSEDFRVAKRAGKEVGSEDESDAKAEEMSPSFFGA